MGSGMGEGEDQVRELPPETGNDGDQVPELPPKMLGLGTIDTDTMETDETATVETYMNDSATHDSTMVETYNNSTVAGTVDGSVISLDMGGCSPFEWVVSTLCESECFDDDPYSTNTRHPSSSRGWMSDMSTHNASWISYEPLTLRPRSKREERKPQVTTKPIFLGTTRTRKWEREREREVPDLPTLPGTAMVAREVDTTLNRSRSIDSCKNEDVALKTEDPLPVPLGLPAPNTGSGMFRVGSGLFRKSSASLIKKNKEKNKAETKAVTFHSSASMEKDADNMPKSRSGLRKLFRKKKKKST